MAAGHVVGASKIARDITEKVRAEQARELLLHEIKHRVKNTLGTVQADRHPDLPRRPQERTRRLCRTAAGACQRA